MATLLGRVCATAYATAGAAFLLALREGGEATLSVLLLAKMTGASRPTAQHDLDLLLAGGVLICVSPPSSGRAGRYRIAPIASWDLVKAPKPVNEAYRFGGGEAQPVNNFYSFGGQQVVFLARDARAEYISSSGSPPPSPLPSPTDPEQDLSRATEYAHEAERSRSRSVGVPLPQEAEAIPSAEAVDRYYASLPVAHPDNPLNVARQTKRLRWWFWLQEQPDALAKGRVILEFARREAAVMPTEQNRRRLQNFAAYRLRDGTHRGWGAVLQGLLYVAENAPNGDPLIYLETVLKRLDRAAVGGTSPDAFAREQETAARLWAAARGTKETPHG